MAFPDHKQALKNVDEAEKNEVSPDTVTVFEDSFKEADQDPFPERGLADDDTSEVALTPSVENMNAFERRFGAFKDVISGTGASRKLNHLSFRRMIGESLTRQEKMDYLKHSDTVQDKLDYSEYELSTGESLLLDVAGSGYNLIRGFWEQRGTTAKGVATGAATGGAFGLFAGPAGGIAGAIGGALTGASVGSLASIVKDTFEQSSGEVYRELGASLSRKGPAAEEERRMLSLGSGVLMSSVFLVLPLATAVKTNPWLKSLTQSKLMSALLASNSAIRNLAFGIGKKILGKQGTTYLSKGVNVVAGPQAVAEATEEAIQETVKILTVLAGETWDGSQTSFIDALGKLELKHVKQVGRAGTVGALAGKGFQIGSKITSPVIQKGLQGVGKVQGLAARKAIEHQRRKEAKKILKEVSIPKVESKKEVQEKPFEPIENERLFKNYLNFIKDGTESVNLSASIKGLYDEYKAIKDQMGGNEQLVDSTLTKKLNLEGKDLYFDSRELEEFLSKSGKVDPGEIGDYLGDGEQIPGIYKIPLLNVFKLMESEPQVVHYAKGDPAKPSGIFFKSVLDEANETGTMPPRLKTALENLETKPIETALAKDENFTRLKSPNEALDSIDSKQSTVNEVNPENEIVELFLSDPQGKIDPTTLPDQYKEKQDIPILQKRGVFNTNGKPLNEVASRYGISPQKLFETLENVDSLTEKHNNRIQFQKETREKLFSPTAKGEKIRKLYNDDIRKFLHTSGLSEKQINSLLSQIQRENFENVLGQKFTDLSAYNSPKVEARKTKDPKEKARLKDLSKLHHLLINHINKDLDWVANLDSDEGVKFIRRNQELRAKGHPDTSRVYVDALYYLRNLYLGMFPSATFDEPNVKNALGDEDPPTDQDYQKFIEYLGNKSFPLGSFEIKENWGALNAPVKDFLNISSTMRQIVNLMKEEEFVTPPVRSRDKDTTTENYDGESVDNIAGTIMGLTRAHTEYKRSRVTESKVPSPSILQKVTTYAQLAYSSIKNMGFMFEKLDQFQVGGYFNTTFFSRLQGVGAFEGQYGLTRYTSIQKEITELWNAGVKKYGKGEFYKLGYTKVSKATKDKLANFPRLNNGNLTKRDLLVILMNMGTQTNRDRVTLFGVTEETMFDILKTELQPRDFDFVQETVWGIFENYRPELQGLELKTRGKDLEVEQALGFTARGKEYQGGYFPISLRRTRRDTDPSTLTEDVSYLTGPKTVYAPHTFERVEDLSAQGYHLDLDYFDTGFDNMAYDLGMRVPIEETIRILGDKRVEDAIVSVIGRQDFNQMSDTLSLMTNKTRPQSSRIYSENLSFVSSVVKNLSRPVVLSALVLNPGTWIISFSPIMEMSGKMGHLNAVRYLLPKLAHLLNPASFFGKNLLKEASRVDPSIGKYLQGSDEFQRRAFKEFVPKEYAIKTKGLRVYNYIPRLHDALNEWALGRILGGIDARLKSVGIMAARHQFLSGDAEMSLAVLDKMTPKAREEAANSYANSLVSKTTMEAHISDKAPIQTSDVGQMFTFFFNELRNVINNRLLSIESSKSRVGRATEAASRGDYNRAQEEMNGVVETMVGVFVTTVLTISLQQLAWFKDPLELKEDEEDEPDGLLERPMSENLIRTYKRMSELTPFSSRGASQIAMSFGGHVPFLRDFLWSAESGRPPGIPIIRSIQDLADAAGIGYDILDYHGEELLDSMAYLEVWEDLDTYERRKLLSALGIIWGGRGIPVSGYYKFKRLLGEDYEEESPIDIGVEFIDRLKDFLKKIQEKKRDPDSQGAAYNHFLKDKALSYRSDPESFNRSPSSRNLFVSTMGQPDLDDLLGTGAYQVTTDGHTFDTLSNAMLDMRIDHGYPNVFSKGEIDALAEKYQLPSYLAENMTQSNAFDLMLKDSVDKLKENGLPVDSENSWMALTFGTDNFIKFKKDKMSFDNLLSDEVRFNQPELLSAQSYQDVRQWYEGMTRTPAGFSVKPFDLDFNVSVLRNDSFKKYGTENFNSFESSVIQSVPEVNVTDLIERISIGETGADNETDNSDDGETLSTAKGLFTISDGTWEGIKRQMPKGIPLTGRFDKPSQYAAMLWLVKDHAQKIRATGQPVTDLGLYFFHHFGAGAGKDFLGTVLNAPSSTLISKAFGASGKKFSSLLQNPAILGANPWLKRIKNVGQFRGYLRLTLDNKERYLKTLKYKNVKIPQNYKYDAMRSIKGGGDYVRAFSSKSEFFEAVSALPIKNRHGDSYTFGKTLRSQLVKDFPKVYEYMDNLITLESKTDPKARNITIGSTAEGLAQFIDKTFKGFSKTESGKILGLDPTGKLRPDKQMLALGLLIQQDIGILKKKKLPVLQEGLYTMHKFGATKGVKLYRDLLTGDNSKSLSFTPGETKLNPGLEKVKNLGQFKAYMSHLFGFRGRVEGVTKDYYTRLRGPYKSLETGEPVKQPLTPPSEILQSKDGEVYNKGDSLVDLKVSTYPMISQKLLGSAEGKVYLHDSFANVAKKYGLSGGEFLEYLTPQIQTYLKGRAPLSYENIAVIQMFGFGSGDSLLFDVGGSFVKLKDVLSQRDPIPPEILSNQGYRLLYSKPDFQRWIQQHGPTIGAMKSYIHLKLKEPN